MEQFQALLAQNTTSGSGTALVKMPDGSVRRYPVGSIPDNATPMSIDGRKVEVKGPSSELVEHKGRMVAKDRVTGLWRPGAGMVDWITGNRTDWDKQGDGTGTAHSVTGAGEVAPGFEKDVKGKITKTIPEDPRSDFEKATGDTMEEWMKRNEDMQLRIGKKKFEQEQLARMPDLMHAAFGGSYAAAAAPGNANLAQIASNSRAYQFGGVNIPTRTNFASLLG